MTDEARNSGGKAEADIGTRERLNQAAGAAQKAYGMSRDVAVEGAQSVKDAIVTGHDGIAAFMEENPHTTTLIELGIGLLIGYSARRPTQRRGWWD